MNISVHTWPDNGTVSLKFEDTPPINLVLTRAELAPPQPYEKRAAWDIGRVALIESFRLRIIDSEVPNRSGPFHHEAWVYYLDVARFFRAVLQIADANLKRFNQHKALLADLDAAYAKHWQKPSEYYQREAKLRESYERSLLAPVWKLERFAMPAGEPAVLGLVEMVRHPNARGEFKPAILRFAKFLQRDPIPNPLWKIDGQAPPPPTHECQWTRLRGDLSRMLPKARIYGQPGARHEDDCEFYFDGRFAGGMGFNGAIILRPTSDTLQPHTARYSVHT